MPEGRNRGKSAFRQTAIHLIWVVVLIAAFGLLLRGQTARVSLERTEDGFAVAAPDGTRWPVAYGAIDSAVLLQRSDWPEIQAENQRGGVRWGVRVDDSGATLHYCLRDGIDIAIWIRPQSGESVLFNYESESGTRELFRQIQSLASIDADNSES